MTFNICDLGSKKPYINKAYVVSGGLGGHICSLTTRIILSKKILNFSHIPQIKQKPKNFNLVIFGWPMLIVSKHNVKVVFGQMITKIFNTSSNTFKVKYCLICM